MKKANRILSLLLAAVLLLSALPVSLVSADAAKTGEIYVKSTYAKAGAEVNVNLKIENNPGILGATIHLSFDDALTLTGAKAGDALSALIMTKPGELTSPCKFTWDGQQLKPQDIKDGVMLTLTFTVAEQAQVGQELGIDVSYSYGDIIDGDLKPLEIAVTGGAVLVIDYTPGDLNDDGRINATDIVLLRRYVTGGYYDNIVKNAADINGDGKVNTTDIVLLRRYIAGGYGVELVPAGEICDHELEAAAAKEATCTAEGNIAYWHCTVCGKFFRDADGNNELIDITVPATGHTVVVDSAVPATYTETGLTEGSHCSVCGTVIVAQEELPVLQSRQHHITYDISNGDSYLEALISNNQLQNSNPDRYNEETGLTLKNLSAAGYRFLGWYDGASSNATQIKKIEASSTEDYELYAHWEVIVYTVQYKSSLFVEKDKDTYTVNTGLTLPTPKLSNYYFLGWSDENGKLVKNNVLPVGTTGNITLSGNWTSERNKTWAKPKLDDPVIHIDEENNIVLFAYEIGKIENVPLYTIKDFGYIAGDGIIQSETATYQTTISESNMQAYARAVSSATTESSSWTLADTWNDIITIDEESCQENGITTEEAESRAKNDTNNWNVSTGKSGSTDTTHLETNQSGWESGGKVTENRGHSSQTNYNEHSNFALNGSFGLGGNQSGTATATGNGLTAALTGGSTVNVGANIGTDNGKSYSEQYNQSWQAGLEIAKKSTGLSVTSDTTVTKSAWNNSSSYGGSSSTSSSSSTSKALSEKISKKYGYGQSYANGGSSSNSQGLTSVQTDSDEYSSSVTYSTSSMNSVTSTWTTTQATKPGYHRWIEAGTAHVFGVIGYDMSSQSFFVYTYSIMDDVTHPFKDYSYSSSSYDDQQNGVIPFEIPYDVVEYVAELTTYSAGLKVNQNTGIITGYTRPEGSEDNIVVIPEYMNVGNGDVVKVTGISSNAFKGNTEIEAVILSNYITEIPDSAFEGCTSLSTVIGGSITSIGQKAFSGCTSMDIFGICNLVTSVGNNAFEGVQALTVNAANVNVVKAAVNSGAKIIDIHVGYIENGATALNGVTLTIPASTEMFSFNGYKDTYNNFSIVSNAAETRIHKTNFVSTAAIPLKIDSAKVVLNQVTVKSAGLGLVLTHDNAELGLQGNVTVNSDNVNAVLCKNTTLYDSNENVEGKLIVSDKILVCGDITGKDHLQYNQYEQIDSDTFDNLLNSYTLNFNVNASGASCTEPSRRVPNSSPIGNLPTPTRTGFDFDGWYTASSGGTKVSSSTTFTTANDITLYAHWNVKAYTANWNTGTGYTITVKRTSSPNKGAATGTISSGTAIYYGDVLSITYTKADYYTIKTSGKTSITVTGNVTASDIYATAELNPVLGWVLASNAPSGAQITNRKYSYDLTSYTTSSSSTMSGWTLYNTTSAWGAYGSWSAWSDTVYTKSDSREVETQQVAASYKTIYHYYYYSKAETNGDTSYTKSNSYPNRYTVTFEKALSTTTEGASVPLTKYKWTNHHGSGKYMFVYADDPYTTQEVASYKTQYRYRDRSLIYTYYFKKVESKESTTNPTGQTNVSNVKEWVLYRAK